jgi:hypothetical protein
VRIPTRAGGNSIVGPEVKDVMQDITQPIFVGKGPPSQTFVAILSIILGLIIGLGTVLGVLGGAFFVRRSEYTAKNLADIQETTILKNALEQVEHALSRQEKSFDKLSEAVQTLKDNQIRKRSP